MKILITRDELQKLKSRDPVPFECEICKSVFYKPKNYALRGIKGTQNYSSCSKECWKKVIGKRTSSYYSKRNIEKWIQLKCEWCHKQFTRLNRIYKTYNVKLDKKCFCSRTCSSKWQNANGKGPQKRTPDFVNLICEYCKKQFTRKWNNYKYKQIHKKELPFCSAGCNLRYKQKLGLWNPNPRSSLEEWIEEKLNLIYPSLNILFNNRSIISSGELDIYIPSLKFAVEINGKYHYEPIYGKQAFEKRNRIDSKKLKECQNKNIDLLIIDMRNYSCHNKTHFEERNKCLKQIVENICYKMERAGNIAFSTS